MQNLVNLLYREEEREMLPLCAAEGIGVIPWSPQARGLLTRDWDYTSIRTETDDAHQRLFGKSAEADRRVVDCVAKVAAARGIPRAQVALAWLLYQPGVTSVIIGAKKESQLRDNLGSVDVKLDAEDLKKLNEVSKLTPEYPGWMFGMQGTDRRPGEVRDWSRFATANAK